MNFFKRIAMGLLILIGITNSYSASTIADSTWDSVLNNTDFAQAENLESLLDIYSKPAISDPNKTEYSSENWIEDPESSNYMMLDHLGLGIIGESIRYNDLMFSGNFTPSVNLDMKITVTNAVLASNQYEDEEYIEFSKSLAGLETSGYTLVTFKAEFFDAGTDNLATVSPLMRFSDIDYDQTVGTDSASKIAVSTDSVLEYATTEDGSFLSYSDGADGSMQDKWALFDYDDTSSLNFAWGMNRLDVNGTENRVGGYTGIDVRLRGSAGKLEVNKVDQDGNPLAGAEFSVYDQYDELKTIITTDENGYAQTPNLGLGDYKIIETNTPIGYVENTNVYNATISSNGEVVNINEGSAVVNSLIQGSVEIYKVDQDGNPLEGVEFTIYDSTDNEVDTIITDAEGHGVSGLLDYGDYYITETKALDGYAMDENQYAFTIDVDQEIEQVNEGNPIVNTKYQDPDIELPVFTRTGQVDLYKVDSSGNPLADAEFTIYNDNGEVEEVLLTDGTGYAISSKLGFGSYSITETKAPNGYLINDSVYNFTIDTADQIITINDGNPIVDEADTEIDESEVDESEVDNETDSEETSNAEKSESVEAEDETLATTGQTSWLITIGLGSLFAIVFLKMHLNIRYKI